MYPFEHPGNEPSLEDLLVDPMIRLRMRSDGLSVADVLEAVEGARHRLRWRRPRLTEPSTAFHFELMPDRSWHNLTARILIVEDEAMVATCIADLLEDAGFTVSGIASSGIEALSIAAAAGADLALADIRLAGPMDGIDLARELRIRDGISSIFLSGADDLTVIQRAESAAPLGFLRKPFLPSQLLNAINLALK